MKIVQSNCEDTRTDEKFPSNMIKKKKVATIDIIDTFEVS